jgi:protein involved in polysaccharide export with SLBB domain
MAERIMPGDRLEVRLNSGAWGPNAEHLWSVGVDPAGRATLPNIGPVRLAGMTTTEAEASIARTSIERDVFLTPVVSVTLKQRQKGSIAVMGAVQSPGILEIEGTSISLADAIVRVGGLTNESIGRITVSQSAQPEGRNRVLFAGGHTLGSTRTVSLLETSASELANIMVPQGAFVSVEKARPQEVQVIGVIRNRTVEIPPGRNLRLLDALTLAGGPKYSEWILDKVVVFRRAPGGDETVRIECSIHQAKNNIEENLLLAPNDVVSVEENAVTFAVSTLQSIFAVGASGMRLAAP